MFALKLTVIAFATVCLVGAEEENEQRNIRRWPGGGYAGGFGGLSGGYPGGIAAGYGGYAGVAGGLLGGYSAGGFGGFGGHPGGVAGFGGFPGGGFGLGGMGGPIYAVGGAVAAVVPLYGGCASSSQCVGVSVCVASACSCPAPTYIAVGNVCRLAGARPHVGYSGGTFYTGMHGYPMPQHAYMGIGGKAGVAFLHPGAPCSVGAGCGGGSFCYQGSCCCPTGLIARGPICIVHKVVAPPPPPPCMPPMVLIGNGCGPPVAVPMLRPRLIVPQALPSTPCGPNIECTGGSVCQRGLCCCPPGLQQQGTVCVVPAVYHPVVQHIPIPRPHMPVVAPAILVAPGHPCGASPCVTGAVCQTGVCACGPAYQTFGSVCLRRRRAKDAKAIEETENKN